MPSSHLRLRANWQTKSGNLAAQKENVFLGIFSELFQDSEYTITKSPKDFNNIYLNLPVLRRDEDKVYVPPANEYRRHGFVPDFSITNTETGKRIFIELKRQDGWIEGGKRADGRGNVHERSCKYFTPGIRRLLLRYSKIDSNLLPFWVVYCGNITRDPCRVREITFWFQEYTDNFFFWRDDDINSVALHFVERIAPHLD